MLTVTENATTAIRELTSSVEADDAGLRIFAQPTENGSNEATLELTLTEGPAMGDQVLDLPESKIYLEMNAAAYLEDKVLDASIEGENVRFSIAEQAPEA